MAYRQEREPELLGFVLPLTYHNLHMTPVYRAVIDFLWVLQLPPYCVCV